MNLIIVESPAKCKTIENFLGGKYKVLSSYGHIRDLPKSELGIDVEQNFKPRYIIPLKARKRVNFLKKEVEKAELTILAVDEDREGEAIAYHLKEALSLNNYQRIVFHEITEPAIKEALKNPREIDINLVNAQQARRILDRLVGYKLSPFLWKKVVKGLSAGRVQSVAVRLIVEREKEIEKFKPEEYWNIEALLQKIQNSKFKIQNYNSKVKNDFIAQLIKKDNKAIPKLGIKIKEEAEGIIKELEGAEYKITDIVKKEVKRSPLPPFTTSTLQQESWKKFRWTAKKTMQIAQQLYETGKITYHRTDSLNLSDSSLFIAKKFIIENYGENYWSGFFRKYKTKSKRAQEAHEAIRPTDPNKKPTTLKLDDQQLKLYQLIWQRFISCQMNSAIFDATTVDISAKNYIFRTTGQTLKFDGFLRVYPIKYEENELPLLEKDEILEILKLIPSQHFTQPLSRYNEATLIKALEQNGIGRPSTYAPIISTIQTRNYVQKNEQKRFIPTEIGVVVNNLLVDHFSEIVNINFTANMENNLDKIAQGKKEWSRIVKDFYDPFEKNLKQKEKELSKQEIAEEKTNKICPKCESPLIIKLGRFGKFYACKKFPECKYTESLEKKNLGIKCPKCKDGNVVEKRTKSKKIFYGCSNWPKCDFALWDKPTDTKCPKCKSLLVEIKKGQTKCSNKECK